MKNPNYCNFRTGAIIYSEQMSYYMDHLAVICHIMNAPLIVSEKNLLHMANHYYPQVQTIYKPPFELSLEYLAENFDLLFVSDKFSRSTLNLFLEAFFKKPLHFFYCPHGNSDKGQLDELMSPFCLQDSCFIYGDQMKDRLKKSGLLEKIKKVVITGNYRLAFYLKFKDFYDSLIQKELFAKFNPKLKTILYAPTWKDQEDSTSFFDICDLLLKQLPPHFNLIVKLHPFLEHYFPTQVYHLLESYKTHSNILFFVHFPLIYPLIFHSDIYLGDFSSIGYDYLSVNRPMFFFNPKERKDEGTFLHSCGIEIPKKSYHEIFSFIELHLQLDAASQTKKRQDLFSYVFGPPKEFSAIRDEVINVCMGLI